MAAMENDFENTTISLYGTVPDSIVDGPGLRYAVFVQGCSHHCPGCHNPESQPCAGGEVRAAPKRRWRPFWPIFAPTASCTT